MTHETGPGGAVMSRLGLIGFARFRSPTVFTERSFPRVPGVRFPDTKRHIMAHHGMGKSYGFSPGIEGKRSQVIASVSATVKSI